MNSIKIRIITSIILILTIISCNSKYDEYNELDDMYRLLSNDFDKDIIYLTDKVNKRLDLLELDSINANNVTKFHSLITEFNSYIEQLEIKLMESNKNPFYLNDSKTDLGTEYITKNKLYREQLLMLIIDDQLKDQLKNKIQTNYYPLKGKKQMVSSFDYFFKGISKSGTLAYLKNKRRNLLEIEKEYINSYRIE